METEKDKDLWKIAKRRVGFKKHLAIYSIINTMFWCIWFFNSKNNDYEGFPWPVWPMLGWAIGLAFDFLGAYVMDSSSAIEKEYKKLKGD